MYSVIKFICILFLLAGAGHSPAQVLEQVYPGLDDDSSYYDIYRLSADDIWIGGEFGVLKRLRADGSLENIVIPNDGSNILKFLPLGDFMYISADHGNIYKYNLKTGSCTRTSFKGFGHRCFYDLAYDNQGHLIVCGGSSGIGRGKKRIPNGFIARIDTSLSQEPEILWSNTGKFVWALSPNPEGGLSAAVFNGFSSQIYHWDLKAGSEWQAGSKVKGLVHALQLIDGKLAYSGCRSIRYHRTGIWGYDGEQASYRQIKGAGIICNLLKINGELYGFSSQGYVYRLPAEKPEQHLFSTHDGFALYEALPDGKDGILLVGHGKSAFLLRLEETN
ncbi:MAG: hypothetical protein KDC13_01740 [Bacteroidetes bacterium]|nr:hypothetical protein [Bacteroidota bacterium]